jgi:hypothetical protein
MYAFGPLADVGFCTAPVRFQGGKADIAAHVRF